MKKCKQNRPVLVFGASPRISLSVARSLHNHGVPVEIASFQLEEPDLRSRAVRQFHRLPSRVKDGNGFSSALLGLIEEKKFDLILPTGDPALAALADLYDELSPMLHVGCPPPKIVERVLNKTLTLETAQRCGIKVPFTHPVSSLGVLESLAPRLAFPLVAKPGKKGAAAFRALYAKDFSQLYALLKQTRWDSVLLQEYCPGVGVGVEILMHNGECVAKFQHRRLKEAPVTGGVAILAIAEAPNATLFQASVQLLRALEWEGPAMVEFRVDRTTGTAVLMEVNGRFWGSVSFPIAAGIDFPLYYWQFLHGEVPAVPDQYRVGMRWRWTPGYVDRMQSVVFRGGDGFGPKPSPARELLSSIGDLSPFVKEAVWNWRDPLPFFAEMGTMLWNFKRALFKAVFRTVAPRKLRTYLGVYSRLEPQARSKYAVFHMRDIIGMAGHNRHPADPSPENVHSVLFVCYGNLMRSPMAETMLRHVLAGQGVMDVGARSAGVHAVKGREAHTWALAVSRELGMPLDEHRAQPTTPELIAGSDLIFAMDYENLAELQTRYPEAAGRILLLSRYADGEQHNREIPDPYFGDIETTRRCYSVLRKCIDKLAKELSSCRARRGLPLAR